MNIQIVFRSSIMSFEREFRQLNEAWISRYFSMEESDKIVLSNPQKYILDKGGNVFLALHDGKVIGCCALLVHDIYTCELAKMVVNPLAQGKGIGSLLGNALINKARERGFRRVVLEGNTKLTASISLYRKLSFKEVPFDKAEQAQKLHSRCNIFMELDLTPLPAPEFVI